MFLNMHLMRQSYSIRMRYSLLKISSLERKKISYWKIIKSTLLRLWLESICPNLTVSAIVMRVGNRDRELNAIDSAFKTNTTIVTIVSRFSSIIIITIWIENIFKTSIANNCSIVQYYQ